MYLSRYQFSFNQRGPFLAEIFQIVATFNFEFVGEAFTKKKEQSENIFYGYWFLQSKMRNHLTFKGAEGRGRCDANCDKMSEPDVQMKYKLFNINMRINTVSAFSKIMIKSL